METLGKRPRLGQQKPRGSMKSRLVPQAEGGVATPPGKGLDACAEKERKILRLVFDERRPVELNRIFLDAIQQSRHRRDRWASAGTDQTGAGQVTKSRLESKPPGSTWATPVQKSFRPLSKTSLGPCLRIQRGLPLSKTCLCLCLTIQLGLPRPTTCLGPCLRIQLGLPPLSNTPGNRCTPVSSARRPENTKAQAFFRESFSQSNASSRKPFLLTWKLFFAFLKLPTSFWQPETFKRSL